MCAWCRTALLAAIVAAGVVPAAGQETTGAIIGAVADGEGSPLPGVTVRVMHVPTGFERATWRVSAT